MKTLCSDISREKSLDLYESVLSDDDKAAQRELCLGDLFYLLLVGFGRKDINRDWLYDRCREFEQQPNGYIDLWSREHYKSTIITYAYTIQDILRNPEITVGIFSHTRPIAKGFLTQIKREFEENEYLKKLFPEILYEDPRKQSPSWSVDNGVLVKRKTNPAANTVEAWGLVDGQPTSKHFSLMIYDDVVTRESVTTPDMMKKVTDAWSLSLNLGARGGNIRYIGTRYHQNDTYAEIMKRNVAIPRIKPATVDGTAEGKPVFLTKQELEEKKKAMGSYIFYSQMLQNPLADKAMGFSTEWLKYYDEIKTTKGWNIYILVDPASKKKVTSDYTVQIVLGLAPDRNFYLLDGIRDRMNLRERTTSLFKLHRKWRPIAVVYEEYGIQADIEHVEYEMELQNYRFDILRVGGGMAKEDRIGRLVPKFENKKIWLPRRLLFVTRENKVEDFVHLFLSEEYESFPVSTHDDMLDCLSRILDIEYVFPENVNCKFDSITEDVSAQDVNFAKTDFDFLF